MDLKTRCARGNPGLPDLGHPLVPVIVPASAFGFSDQAAVERYFDTGQGYVYSRNENPTVRQVERFLAQLEEGESAALFASGMAAISTLFLTLGGAGRRVAAQRALYGGTADLLRSVLPGLGMEVAWFERDQLARLEPGDLKGCSLLFLESPINPTLRLVDLSAAAAAARRAGVPVAVDSTFATPILQRPLALGVDLVVHSATKYLGGHSDLLGGAIVGRDDLVERISQRRRSLGGTMDPFTAFLLHRGMRTLAVRMQAHCIGAEAVARFLAGHDRVEAVHYPGLPDHPDRDLARRQMTGFGGMVSFIARGGPEAAKQVHDRLELFARAGSLGGVESLVSIPARMSHRRLGEEERERVGVPSTLVRLSVGLESPADLVADLDRALG